MQSIVLKAKLKRNLSLIFSLLFLLLGISVGIVLVGQTQILEKEAAGVCPVEGTSCEWSYKYEEEPSIGVIFNYEIVDLTTGETVKRGTTQTRRVTFTPIADHQYSCKVSVSNVCGTSPERTALNTCTAQPPPSATPTLSITPRSTPLPTATGTPGPSPTFTPTPGGPTLTGTPGLSPTSTVTGTPGPSPTPSITQALTPSSTPTLTPTIEITPSATPTQAVGAPAPTSTPTPLVANLPESGLAEATAYIFLSAIFLILFGMRLLL